jgi:hypothetical protein
MSTSDTTATDKRDFYARVTAQIGPRRNLLDSRRVVRKLPEHYQRGLLALAHPIHGGLQHGRAGVAVQIRCQCNLRMVVEGALIDPEQLENAVHAAAKVGRFNGCPYAAGERKIVLTPNIIG